MKFDIVENIVLRQWQHNDKDALKELFLNTELLPIIESNTTLPLSSRFLHNVIDNLRDKKHSIDKAIEYNGRVVGTIGLNYKRDNSESAEVSIFIDKKFRYKGIGTSAILLLCDYVENKTDIVRLNAIIKEDNVVSYKAFEKCGFVRCSTVIKQRNNNQRYRAYMYLRILEA